MTDPVWNGQMCVYVHRAPIVNIIYEGGFGGQIFLACMLCGQKRWIHGGGGAEPILPVPPITQSRGSALTPPSNSMFSEYLKVEALNMPKKFRALRARILYDII